MKSSQYLIFTYRYFKNKLSIVAEFIPQVIFLVFLFFYMVLLMFIKWFMYYPTNIGKYLYLLSGFFFFVLPEDCIV
jgi:hypothetical protein